MNLIICLDDKNGYCFASRRQSSDKIQIEKMLALVGKNKLFLNAYSAKLFGELPNITVCENPLEGAKNGDYCFIENITLNDISTEKVIIYRWNRHYPSDKKFPEKLLSGKALKSTIDFVGNSHERITEEVYE